MLFNFVARRALSRGFSSKCSQQLLQPRHIQALILDGAGTLFDFGCTAVNKAFKKYFAERNIHLTREQIDSFTGSNKIDHLKALYNAEFVRKQIPGSKIKTFPLEGEAGAEEFYQKEYEAYKKTQLNVFKTDYMTMRLIPGVCEFILAQQKKGVKVGITSGYDAEMMNLIVTKLNNQGFFANAVVSSTGMPSRPDPGMCLEAAKQMAVDPEYCVVVDDTRIGIQAGKNAGMIAVGVVDSSVDFGLSEREHGELRVYDYPSFARQEKLIKEHLMAAGADYTVPTLGHYKMSSVLSQVEAVFQSKEASKLQKTPNLTVGC
ncbi:MAG: HAD-IA family hydrolase [Gammaproteobacteria bacterium]